jgi:T5SS/PEP-CTERM-associated repeat protein
MKGPQVLMHLSDTIYVGVGDGSEGLLYIEDYATLEVGHQYIGYYSGSYGVIVVDGPGTSMSTWTNSDTTVGYIGTGELVIQNGADVFTGVTSGYATLGFINGSQGTAIITGNGSVWTIASSLIVGRGDNNKDPGNPGVGILKVQRGGLVIADTMSVGQTSYAPKGTLNFTIGDNGSGADACGKINVSGTVRLSEAYLQIDVDPGTNLTLGAQYVLVDYGSLGAGASYKQFIGINDGDIYTSPRGYYFQIDYDADLGGGDHAITATVTNLPPCVVEMEDLYLLIYQWTNGGCGPPDNCLGADINIDTNVNLADFSRIAAYWQSGCPEHWPWQ